MPDEGLSIAVAVQKMVNARASGVAMTVDPTNGDRSKIVIDASYGLGEMVVSGQVTPDNIRVDKVMLAVVAETLGDKHAELVPDPATRSLVEREVDAERRARRSLTDAEVRAVAAMAKRAEKHYGCPQDIEWALDADLPDGENLLLLQSRPETVWSASKSRRQAQAAAPATGSAASPGSRAPCSPQPATLRAPHHPDPSARHHRSTASPAPATTTPRPPLLHRCSTKGESWPGSRSPAPSTSPRPRAPRAGSRSTPTTSSSRTP